MIGKQKSASQFLRKILDYCRYLMIDSYVISFPKSGTTWLDYIFQQYDMQPKNIKFTSDVVGEPYQDTLTHSQISDVFCSEKYQGKRNIFLVRDPRDVVVSYYYHKTLRELLSIGKASFSGTLDDFILDDVYGIKKIVAFMNLWAETIQQENYVVVAYEDMIENINREMIRIFYHLRLKIDYPRLYRAIKASTFEKMEIAERDRLGELPVNQRKTRKGIVGGYKQELSQEMIKFLDAYIAGNLNIFYKRRYRQ